MENKEVKPRLKRGLWKPEEDLILKTYVANHGEGNWAAVSAKSGKALLKFCTPYDCLIIFLFCFFVHAAKGHFGLMRGGKSCRLRWKNYLRPNIKRGGMSQEEEDLIIRMHKLLGNRWSLIAGRLPGRTDNEVKNYWNTHLNKRCIRGERKTRDPSDCQNEHDDKNKNKRKNCCQPLDSQPVCSTVPTSTTEEVNGKKEDNEESRIKDTWVQEEQSMNYYTESPMMAFGNAMIAFEDDPFADYSNPFGLFESFVCSPCDDNRLQLVWSPSTN